VAVFCRVSLFCRVFFLICRVVFFQHSTKCLLCRVPLFCRVWFLQHSANDFFVECPIKYTWRLFWHSKNHLFPVVVQGCKEKTSYLAQAITGNYGYPEKRNKQELVKDMTASQLRAKALVQIIWDSNRFSCRRTIKVAQNKWALVWLDKRLPNARNHARKMWLNDGNKRHNTIAWKWYCRSTESSLPSSFWLLLWIEHNKNLTMVPSSCPCTTVGRCCWNEEVGAAKHRKNLDS